MHLKTPRFLIAATLTLAAATPLTAQWRPEPLVQIDRAPASALTPPVLQLPDSVRPAPSTATLGMVGVAGAWGGALAGAFLGYQLGCAIGGGCWPGFEDENRTGRQVGWLVGPALLTPLTVHHANGGRGSLSNAYLSAALISGATMVGVWAGEHPWAALIAANAPFLHVISAVVVEQGTAP